MTEIINKLTERLEGYYDAITDCGGDHDLFAENKGKIDELEFVLNLLIKLEDHKKSWLARIVRRKLFRRC